VRQARRQATRPPKAEIHDLARKTGYPRQITSYSVPRSTRRSKSKRNEPLVGRRNLRRNRSAPCICGCHDRSSTFHWSRRFSDRAENPADPWHVPRAACNRCI